MSQYALSISSRSPPPPERGGIGRTLLTGDHLAYCELAMDRQQRTISFASTTPSLLLA